MRTWTGSTGDGGGSFEERLRAARTQQGLDAPAIDAGQRARRKGVIGARALGLRVGVELVSALAVAVAIGWALDRWLHTLPLFLSCSSCWAVGRASRTCGG